MRKGCGSSSLKKTGRVNTHPLDQIAGGPQRNSVLHTAEPRPRTIQWIPAMRTMRNPGSPSLLGGSLKRLAEPAIVDP